MYENSLVMMKRLMNQPVCAGVSVVAMYVETDTSKLFRSRPRADRVSSHAVTLFAGFEETHDELATVPWRVDERPERRLG